MAGWYRAGSVTLTHGSKAVQGANTSWVGNVIPGSIFLAPDGYIYEVGTVSAAGALTLATPYSGPDVAGGAYAAAPTQAYLPELAQRVTDLLDQLGELKAEWLAGDLQGSNLRVLGAKPTVADLPALGNRDGDSWLVDGDLHTWTGTAWFDAGPFRGPKGEPGDVNPLTLQAVVDAQAAAAAAELAEASADEHAAAAETARQAAATARASAEESRDAAATARQAAETAAGTASDAAVDAEAARQQAAAAQAGAAAAATAAGTARAGAETAATSADQDAAAADQAAAAAATARTAAQGFAATAGNGADAATAARDAALAAQAAAEAARDDAEAMVGGISLGNTPAAPLAPAAAPGTASTAARSDHTHPLPTRQQLGLPDPVALSIIFGS